MIEIPSCPPTFERPAICRALSAAIIAVLGIGVADLALAQETSVLLLAHANSFETDNDRVRADDATGPITLEERAGEEGVTDSFGLCRSGGSVNAGSAAAAVYSRSGGDWNGLDQGGLVTFGICSSTVKFTFDDVVVSGAGGSVETYINLDLSGSQWESVVPDQDYVDFGLDFEGESRSILQIDVRIGNQRLRADRTTRVKYRTTESPVITEDVDPPLDVVLPATITIGPFQVTANQPFEVEVALIASSSADWIGIFGGKGTAESNADYGSTVTLSAGGPVFDLPEGYTASSTDGDVVDNMWEGTAVEPVTVPEPGATASMAAVLLALAGARQLSRS